MFGGGEVVEGEVLFATVEGFSGEVDAGGFSAFEGGGDGETAGVGEGVQEAFGAKGAEFGAVGALVEEEAVAVAGGDVEAVADAGFGDDGGEGESGVAGVEDGGDAVGVFEGEKAGEDAGGAPEGFGGPGFESGEEGVQGGGVFVGEDDVVAEAFDPAIGAGGETVGGGAGLG